MIDFLALMMTSMSVGLTASHLAMTKEAPQASQAPSTQGPATTAETDHDSTAETKADSQPEFPFHEIETKLISATNEERARYGLPQLTVDYGLMRSARRHTAWMTRSRRMQHTTANVAENIAMGQRSVSGVISTWMNSPGHRANLLNGSYRRLGVAAYRTPDGTIFWCQQFLW